MVGVSLCFKWVACVCGGGWGVSPMIQCADLKVCTTRCNVCHSFASGWETLVKETSVAFMGKIKISCYMHETGYYKSYDRVKWYYADRNGHVDPIGELYFTSYIWEDRSRFHGPHTANMEKVVGDISMPTLVIMHVTPSMSGDYWCESTKGHSGKRVRVTVARKSSHYSQT